MHTEPTGNSRPNFTQKHSEYRQEHTRLATDAIRQGAIRDRYEDARQRVKRILPAVDPG